jgi:hypothetical protein
MTSEERKAFRATEKANAAQVKSMKNKLKRAYVIEHGRQSAAGLLPGSNPGRNPLKPKQK